MYHMTLIIVVNLNSAIAKSCLISPFKMFQRDYWRIVEDGESHVAVHKASLDTSVTGR